MSNKRYDWLELQRKHDEGLTWRELTEQYGVSSASLFRAIQREVFVSSTKSEAGLARDPKTRKGRSSLKYDWSEIQKFHDEGHTWREITEKFGVGKASIAKAAKRGDFTSMGRSAATKLSRIRKPLVLSQETKDKISNARKKFLQENPDKVPYLLNHYSKRLSYAEKYFQEAMEGSSFSHKHRIANYELDLADIERKIDLEIDGDQHFLDPRIVEHDKKRNLFLSELGWSVIRIKWSAFQRLTKEEKEYIIGAIKKGERVDFSCVFYFDPSVDQTKLEFFETKQEARQKRSNADPFYKSKPKLNARKVERPSLIQLEKDLRELSCKAVGRKYGVTDNSIRKWIRLYRTNKFFKDESERGED